MMELRMATTHPFAGNFRITPYSTAHAANQTRRNSPMVPQGLAFSRAASTATYICAQYQKPTNTVTTALQRNHHSAGRVRFLKTLGLAAASTFFMNGTLIRLKK